MTKDEFYQQMLNIAEEKIIEKHRSMRKKNVKYMQRTIDPKRPYQIKNQLIDNKIHNHMAFFESNKLVQVSIE